MEWNMFINQQAINLAELEKLSNYMSEMIGYDDMASKVNDIIDEVMDTKEFKVADVEALRNTLIDYVKHYKEVDRFSEFKVQQREYIKLLDELKNNKDFVRQLRKC